MRLEELATIVNTTDKSPALVHFRKLHYSSRNTELPWHLANFKNAAPLTEESFRDGVENFTWLANTNTVERERIFGGEFYGIHYNNDLAKLWNWQFPDQTVNPSELRCLAPPEWDYDLEKKVLIYKGSLSPSQALNILLQGPTVIDCGMFCQLAIWFGIRHVLGDPLFDQLFGHAPLYITQYNYAGITDPKEAYKGNPLYPFFRAASKDDFEGIGITYFRNASLYPYKHLGGNYIGENAIRSGKTYTIFDPYLPKNTDLTSEEIETLLQETFNAPPNENDQAKLNVYKNLDPNEYHSPLSMSCEQLITYASALTDHQISNDTWSELKSNKAVGLLDECNLQFDFELFLQWVNLIRKISITQHHYTPLTDHQLSVPDDLKEKIPFENITMSFNRFSAHSSVQQDMKNIALTFCEHVMAGKPHFVVLTGRAGMGKTAAMVCSAHELASKGKRILWISEVTVKKWMDKAETIEEVLACRNDIQELIRNTQPDVICLDDDNMVGYSGRVLLEEMYSWYAEHPGKSLFITSNEPIDFNHSFGWNLNGTYDFPPFINYDSSQYVNTVKRKYSEGKSLRSEEATDIVNVSDDRKINALVLFDNTGKASAGIIISENTYLSRRESFTDPIEYIPGFDKDILASVYLSFQDTKTLGPAYEQLTPLQKKWLYQFTVPEHANLYNKKITPEFQSVGEKPFIDSNCNIIAIEIMTLSGMYKNCVDAYQLLRVIHYAHDKGGIKLIIINKTPFSDNELIKKIEEQIVPAERERTMARLKNLLFSPALYQLAIDNPAPPLAITYPGYEPINLYICLLFIYYATRADNSGRINTNLAPTPNVRSATKTLS